MAAAGFISLSEWSFTICPTHVLNASLNKTFPSFLHSVFGDATNQLSCFVCVSDVYTTLIETRVSVSEKQHWRRKRGGGGGGQGGACAPPLF